MIVRIKGNNLSNVQRNTVRIIQIVVVVVMVMMMMMTTMVMNNVPDTMYSGEEFTIIFLRRKPREIERLKKFNIIV